MDCEETGASKRYLFPKLVFGTSNLGNLFEDIGYAAKKSIVAEILQTDYSSWTEPEPSICFDCAGKYGAGLALELLGRILDELQAPPSRITISNKLGWRRIPLLYSEPTFEPGAWVNLSHDAVQDISYTGILRCYHEGNVLLGQYKAEVVSIHDPDEYLATASGKECFERRMIDIMDGYRALFDLKRSGVVKAVGVGAKDSIVIEKIADMVHQSLDWVMIACQLTLHDHSSYTRRLVKRLADRGIQVLNSAVFNSGFLVGGMYYNYKKVSEIDHSDLFVWRSQLIYVLSNRAIENIDIEAVCITFAFLFDGVKTVVLNASTAEMTKRNLMLVYSDYSVIKGINSSLWGLLEQENLINVEILRKEQP